MVKPQPAKSEGVTRIAPDPTAAGTSRNSVAETLKLKAAAAQAKAAAAQAKAAAAQANPAAAAPAPVATPAAASQSKKTPPTRPPHAKTAPEAPAKQKPIAPVAKPPVPDDIDIVKQPQPERPRFSGKTVPPQYRVQAQDTKKQAEAAALSKLVPRTETAKAIPKKKPHSEPESTPEPGDAEAMIVDAAEEADDAADEEEEGEEEEEEDMGQKRSGTRKNAKKQQSHVGRDMEDSEGCVCMLRCVPSNTCRADLTVGHRLRPGTKVTLGMMPTTSAPTEKKTTKSKAATGPGARSAAT
jgi:hypothetical protein